MITLSGGGRGREIYVVVAREEGEARGSTEHRGW